MVVGHISRRSALNFLPRLSYSSTSAWLPVRELPDGQLETFRSEAFIPSKPVLLPRKHFLKLPAAQKWFVRPREGTSEVTLNRSYLQQFEESIVPLEFTRLDSGDKNTFARAEAPLHIFLRWAYLATPLTSDRLYLAQASLSSLPKALADDLATPEFVLKAGSGDIYDTNIWMGIPPTYTPLHRDPNPNLFVQLAGAKVVRILEPEAGNRIFARVQNILGRSDSTAFRGDSMMKGQEKKLLDSEIWGGPSRAEGREVGYEVSVEAGDGLFIPKGWWHSIKGVGNGITASVNWWFR